MTDEPKSKMPTKKGQSQTRHKDVKVQTGSKASKQSATENKSAADEAALLTAQYAPKDPEAMAQNLARMVEQAGYAASAWLSPRDDNPKDDATGAFFKEISDTLGKVAQHWTTEPERAIEAQTALFSQYMQVWSNSIQRYNDPDTPRVVELDRRDRRFSSEAWQNEPLFDFLKQAFLVTSRWAEDLVDGTDGIDEHTRHKAHFYVQQITNALSPSNFYMTDPDLLKQTMAENGENLVRGMGMLANDLDEGDGELRVKMVDKTGFAVGKNMAVTPGKVVAQNEVRQLIQYSPTTDKVLKRPLLIVPPWINKFYILDLNEKNSYVKWCVEQGHTVFVISWVNPNAEHAGKSFEHYAKEGIVESLDVIEDITGEDGVNAIGYCVGGTLLAVTLALMARWRDERIKSATFFTTQVDFTNAGDLKVFADEQQISALENNMNEKGYLEGKRMSGAFNLLRSADLVWPYVVNNYVKGKQPLPFDLLYWNSDSTNMPALNHSFYMRNCYLENRLSAGTMVVANEQLNLSDVKIPIYNLATKDDHIAPALSVFDGSKFFGGDVQYIMAGSGHIAGVVNPPTKQKYQYWTGGKPIGKFDDWVAKAEEHPGSWWLHWHDWIKTQNAQMVDARTVGNKTFKPIEDAPGSYVKAQA